MHHKMTVKLDGNFPGRPYLAECSCGPKGNFREIETANGFLARHAMNLLGMNTSEFTDLTAPKQEPEPQPELAPVEEPKVEEQAST